MVVLGAGVLSTAATQVRLQDAAADAARLAARGESSARVNSVAVSAAPGATVGVQNQGDLVCVTVSAPALLGITLTANGCALAGGL